MRIWLVDRFLDLSEHGPSWWRRFSFAAAVWVYTA